MEDKMEEKIEAIKRVQDYISANLMNKITLLELSKVSYYSTFYTEKIFKEIVGVKLFDYIRKLRLTEAAKNLRDSNPKILDTALDFLFDSHEGFSRAFSKEFGLSPYKYKKNPVPVPYFIAYKVISSYILKQKKEILEMKTRTIFTQIVERPLRKAIVKRGKKAEDYFAYCEEVGCEVWGVLTSIKEALFEPSGYWLPKEMIPSGTSKYIQGVEVPFDYNGAVPVGFELITLQPCMLMIFNGEPFNDEDFMEEIGYVWDAIKKFSPETYGYLWDESQPRFQLEPRGERGYIEAKPIIKVKR